MSWQPAEDSGTGDTPGSGLPRSAEPVRDSPLSGFAKDGAWDSCPPSAALAAVLEAAACPGQRCPGATRDELLGMLRQWQALESWAAAGKLALLRALIRDDDQPLPGGSYHGDLPDGWTKSLTHEVALALSMPAVSAENQMWLAWNLQAVLPGIGAMLANGQLTLPKARAVDQALTLLSAPDAAKAEAMVLPELTGKTYSQVEKLAVQAAATVDPESATRRRKDAEQHRFHGSSSREDAGAAALERSRAADPPSLAAHASICARAEQYKESGAFPKDARMDQYRATAYLDPSPMHHRRHAHHLWVPCRRPTWSLQIAPQTHAPAGRRPQPPRRRSSPTWCSRWPRCLAWLSAPAKATASARSTRACAASSPSPPRPARGPSSA